MSGWLGILVTVVSLLVSLLSLVTGLVHFRRLRDYRLQMKARAVLLVVNAPFRLPSISRGLLALAVQRLPAEMDTSQKERWVVELYGDFEVVSGPVRRLFFAFRVWRRGIPGLVGVEGAPRSARNQ